MTWTIDKEKRLYQIKVIWTFRNLTTAEYQEQEELKLEQAMWRERIWQKEFSQWKKNTKRDHLKPAL